MNAYQRSDLLEAYVDNLQAMANVAELPAEARQRVASIQEFQQKKLAAVSNGQEAQGPISAEEYSFNLRTARSYWLAQVLETLTEKDRLDENGNDTFNGQQNLLRDVVFETEEYMQYSPEVRDIMAKVKESINYTLPELESGETKRKILIPGTKVEIETLLTGYNRNGFRQMDPSVADKVAEISKEMGVKFISSPLGQGNIAQVYDPANPHNLEEYGSGAFRGKKVDLDGKKQGVDGAIINMDPNSEEGVGFFAAINGAAFGVLVETDQDGNAVKAAQVFLGPNNLYGADKSIIQTTLEEGNFDLKNTHFYFEHGEGDVFAAEGAKYDSYGAEIRRRYEKKSAWQRIKSFFGRNKEQGESVLDKIRPARKSEKAARYGQQVFNINEAVLAEAKYCGIANVTYNDNCPTESGKHASNTMEQSFVSGKFLPPGEKDPKNHMLFIRNGYFVKVSNKS